MALHPQLMSKQYNIVEENSEISPNIQEKLTVSGTLDPENLNLAMALIEEHELIDAKIIMHPLTFQQIISDVNKMSFYIKHTLVIYNGYIKYKNIHVLDSTYERIIDDLIGKTDILISKEFITLEKQKDDTIYSEATKEEIFNTGLFGYISSSDYG